MRKLLVLGCMAAFIPMASHAANERASKEEGERTYLCWRYERDAEKLWVMRSFQVEAHNGIEALTLCFERLNADTRRQNRRVVRT